MNSPTMKARRQQPDYDLVSGGRRRRYRALATSVTIVDCGAGPEFRVRRLIDWDRYMEGRVLNI